MKLQDLKEGFYYAGFKWEDTTSYSRDCKERIPTTFTAKRNSFSITITSGHIYYKPEWIFHAREFGFDTKHIGNFDTPYHAIDKALELIEIKLNTLRNEFYKEENQ